MPTGIDVKLTNTPDWSGSDAPLVAEYDLKVPGWAASAGTRVPVASGLFGGARSTSSSTRSRVHPLYFSYPYQHTDDVTIELPAGWQVSSVPKPRTADLKVVTLQHERRKEAGGTLQSASATSC